MPGLPKMSCLVFAVLFGIQLGASSGFEIRREGTTSENSRVYWNVPTVQCHKHGINFEEVTQKFHIRQNPGDEFRGDVMSMLYDPGLFPALDGQMNRRNGGVPQAGNLGEHLELFKEAVILHIPKDSYHGLAVIDFEKWRPIYRQNWASLNGYRTLSEELVGEENPQLSPGQRTARARQQLETSGRQFMEETLKLAVALRPGATWGYYGFPYCYNWTPGNLRWNCEAQTVKDNDAMSWLFEAQNVTLPSVYLRLSLTPEQRMSLIEGRVMEAMRVAGKSNPRKKVLVFIWFKYQGDDETYLTAEDLVNGIRLINELGADGYILWGSSNDVNTRKKCGELHDYLNNVLGPAIVEAEEQVSQHETGSDDQAKHIPNLEDERENLSVLTIH